MSARRRYSSAAMRHAVISDAARVSSEVASSFAHAFASYGVVGFALGPLKTGRVARAMRDMLSHRTANDGNGSIRPLTRSRHQLKETDAVQEGRIDADVLATGDGLADTVPGAILYRLVGSSRGQSSLEGHGGAGHG